MGKIKQLVRERNVDVLLLQESKRSSVDASFVKSIWPYEEMEFMGVDSEGSAGGLLSIWRPEVFKLTDCCCSKNFVLLSGRQFTWCNTVEGERWSRIDRFLLDSRWLEIFSFKQWGLPRTVSDHCPILLKEDERDWGPKPFKFLNPWLAHPSFMPAVKQIWENNQVSGWAGFRLMRKLRDLRSHLRIWNKEVFGNIDALLKSAEEELHEWDLQAESGSLDDASIRSRREARSLVWKLCRDKARLWHQKSRVLWAQNGDKNTSRQRKNLLDSVCVEGECLEEPAQIKQAVVRHFSKQFKECWSARPKLSGPFKVINSEAAAKLEVEFTEAEILVAIQDCDGNKAPGPDGLPLGANPRRKSTWDPVVAKFQKKLSSWKRRLLSFAGRLTLIKSALSNLPLYFLSIFKMPKGIVKAISKIQANFLWGSSAASRKVHMVKWREVTKGKNQGGLGIRDLGVVNECLLLKWWWRYGSEDTALWKVVICSSLSTEKEDTLQQMCAKIDASGRWQLQFRRSLLAWEEEELQRLVVSRRLHWWFAEALVCIKEGWLGQRSLDGHAGELCAGFGLWAALVYFWPVLLNSAAGHAGSDLPGTAGYVVLFCCKVVGYLVCCSAQKTGVMLLYNAVGLLQSVCGLVADLVWVKAVSLLLLGTGWFGLIFILTNFLTRGQARLHIVGWFCLVFSVCVFAAPLNIMKQVIRTKSVEFMPFYLSLSLTFSAIMWFFYGILRKDLNISIPNVIGFILGVLQMILYAIYKNGKKVEEQGPHVVEERQTEVVEEAVEQCIDVSAKPNRSRNGNGVRRGGTVKPNPALKLIRNHKSTPHSTLWGGGRKIALIGSTRAGLYQVSQIAIPK
ncbi:hypothetical protein HYC85_027813 [Camellia sinensis]|uniref:Bidirectional sugar transporter SWEET n=1 Tax=Camellia sinensis TaxID=4442 RepID=A0A7J7FTJ1_CAMSI|nr:hypothetical protein HYC85_027813 [Camellia sinensis]